MEPWLKVRNPPNSQAFWTPGEKSLSSLLHSLTSNIETEEKPITLNCRRKRQLLCSLGFPGGSAGKESTCNEEELGSIPGLGRSTRERNNQPVHYSGLENSMDCIVLSLLQGIFPTQGSNPGLLHYRWILYQLSRKGSPSIVHGVVKSRTQPSDFHFHLVAYLPCHQHSPHTQV